MSLFSVLKGWFGSRLRQPDERNFNMRRGTRHTPPSLSSWFLPLALEPIRIPVQTDERRVRYSISCGEERFFGDQPSYQRPER